MGENSKNFSSELSVCKPLSKDVRSLVRSGIAITTVAQCVEELVLNSVDAKATCIYVGVNLDRFNVRVEDDGIGVSKKDLALIGTRYTTSKCNSIEDLSALKHYGYRGEALASIIEVSTSVELTSRTETSGAPYRRQFNKGKPRGSVDKLADSKKKDHGLNVLVSNLLSELPVRQKRLNRSIQIEEIKSTLQRIALINPAISIEFRNDANGTQVLNYSGCGSMMYAFKRLFSSKSGVPEMNLVEEHYYSNGVFFMACIGRETYRSNCFQFVYVNKRYIARNKIYRHLNKGLMQFLVDSKMSKQKKEEVPTATSTKEKFPVFIVNIKCPFDMYDITLEPKKLQVEFRDWEMLAKGLDGLVQSFHYTFDSTNKCSIVRKSFGILKSKEETKRTSGISENEGEGHRRGTRKSSNSTGHDSTLGEGITTHDLKGAVHSRFAVRETAAADDDDDVDGSDCEVRSVNSTPIPDRPRSSILSSSPFDNEKSRKGKKKSNQRYLLPKPPVDKPCKLITSVSRSRKRNIFDLKRVRGGKQMTPLGAKKVYVRKKPTLNAAVFQKFPQWNVNESSSPEDKSPSTSMSVEEIPPKKSKQSGGMRKETTTMKYKFSNPNILNKFKDAGAGYSELLNRMYGAKNENREQGLLEKFLDKNNLDEEKGYDWKMQRYISDVTKESAIHLSSSESEKEDDIDKIVKENEKCKNTEKETKDKLIKPGNPGVAKSNELAKSCERTNSATGNETIKVPEEWTWVLDKSKEGIKEFHDRNFGEGTNRLKFLKEQMRQGLQSTESGRDLIEKLDEQITEGQRIRDRPGGPSHSFLRPSQFGHLFGSSRLVSFKDLNGLNPQQQSQEKVAPIAPPPPPPPPQMVKQTLPFIGSSSLPLATPDPYGLNKLIKSRVPRRVDLGLSSGSFGNRNELDIIEPPVINFGSQERIGLQELKLNAAAASAGQPTCMPSFSREIQQPIAKVFGEQLGTIPVVHVTKCNPLPAATISQRQVFPALPPKAEDANRGTRTGWESKGKEEESSEYFMPGWVKYTKKEPTSRSIETQWKEKAPREFPRETSTSEYFQPSGDNLSPCFVINESTLSKVTNVDEERMSVEVDGTPKTEGVVCKREIPSTPSTPLVEALMNPPCYIESPYFSPAVDEDNIHLASQESNVEIKEIIGGIEEEEPLDSSPIVVIRRENGQDWNIPLPPPCEILPSQILQREGGEWDDRMMFDTREDSYDEDWDQWEVDVVSDSKGQDWLQTEDEGGRTLYINLSTGDSSYDMVHLIVNQSRKVPAGQAARMNGNFKYNWLRRYFPKGSHKFWKPDDGKERITLNGDLHLVDKGNETLMGPTVREFIKKGNFEAESKWRDGLRSRSGPGSEGEDQNGIYLSESWTRPLGQSEMPVSNLNAPEMKFWNKIQGNVQSSFRFVKQDLSRAKVLMQLDRKFIVAKISTLWNTEKVRDILVLFDQHAVHERIRLEQLIQECYVESERGDKLIGSLSIIPPMPLNFSDTEVRIMQSYEDAFLAIGVKVEYVNSTCVKISSTPNCFAEKVATEAMGNREESMKKLLTSLLQEQVNHIIDTKGSAQAMPKTIFNILCSQACHGAIKFGDSLDLSVCEKLLTSLKSCKTPFQCAHGRPALVPLLDLASYKTATDFELKMAHEDDGEDPFEDSIPSQGKKFEKESSYFHDQSLSTYFS